MKKRGFDFPEAGHGFSAIKGLQINAPLGAEAPNFAPQ